MTLDAITTLGAASVTLALMACAALRSSVQARKALAQSQFEFDTVLMNAPEGILIADGAGMVVFANHRATEILGFEPREMIGRPIEAMVPEALSGPTSEILGRRKDGTEFPMEVSLRAVALGENRPFVLAFVSDITHRRETEQRIRDYEERLARAARSEPC